MNAMREQIYVTQMQSVLTPMELMSAYVTQDMKDPDSIARVGCVRTVRKLELLLNDMLSYSSHTTYSCN